MPIRVSPANRSPRASTSAQTRVMIAPTVRHAMRINCVTAVFEHCVTSHATVWSKASVCPAPCRAHGTYATTTPCSPHRTRGASASRKTRTVPASNARQRRRPSPQSERPHRRRQIPQRPRAPRVGRTRATMHASPPVSPHASSSTRSMTVFSTPSRAPHTLALRTSFSAEDSGPRQPRT